jgi:hypothetical protein
MDGISKQVTIAEDDTQNKKNMFSLKQSDSMNTLFDNMLKQYREKRHIISANTTHRLATKDINEVFRPLNNKLDDSKIIVEEPILDVPTLFKPSKISNTFMNPQMIVQ